PVKTTIKLYQCWAGKWRREDEIKLPRFKNGNGTNFPLLRYVDVLLMFAEADNHVNGSTQSAYDAINRVTELAYGSGNRVSSVNFNPAADGGIGYTLAPYVIFDKSGDANGANTADGYTTIANGRVTSVVLVNRGAFYGSVPPNVTFVSIDGNGSGASATVNVTPIDPSQARLQPGM